MTFNQLDDKSQGAVIAYSLLIGTVVFGLGYAFFDFIKGIAGIGWYVAVPMWIACMFVSYPVAFGAAQASTTCGNCKTAWAKHQTDEKEIMQVFPRTEKRGDKLVHNEVTRYRIFHECNHCGHRTHQEKESVRKLY